MAHQLTKSNEGIIIVSISLIAAASAFMQPSSSIHHFSANLNLIQQCAPRQPQRPFFVLTEKNVFVAENDINDDEDENTLLVTQDGSKTLGEADQVNKLVARKDQPVFTTAEEAAIFVSQAPVSPEEGLSGDGLLWRGAVVILCALWASNFAVAKIILAEPGVDASLYAVARFSLAFLSLLPGSISAARKGLISWETAKGAVVCGSWVAFGYLGQLIGLINTTPSRSCVICSLNCIFVAIVAETLRVNSAKDRGYLASFDLKKLIPALIAVAGVAIIELKGAAGDPNIGDLISFAQPIGFGMGYLQLEGLMKKQPSAALPVSAIKLLVVSTAALLFFEASPHASANLVASVDADSVVEGAKQSLGGIGLKVPDFTPILKSPTALGAIFYTGLVTTSLALWVESIAFQRVPATDASIILSTEPLFAAAVSAVLVGETFGASDAIGASFIVGACIYAIKMGEGEEVCDEITKECVVDDAP